jgi:hypothetical protein
MQFASSLLQYLTTQRNGALGLDASSAVSPKRKHLTPSGRKSKEAYRLSQALLWGTGSLNCELDGAFEELISATDLVASIGQKKSGQKREVKNKQLSLAIAQWINNHLPMESGQQFVALVAASWIYTLRHASATLPSSLWLETLQNILTQVDRAWNECDSESLLPTLIWGCEIPLALATQIDQIDGNTKLVLETRQRLKFLISRVEDAEAMWLRSGGAEVRALLAGVLRCTWLLSQLEGKSLSLKDYRQLFRYARAGLSLSELGGQPLLQVNAITDDNSLWHAIVASWPHNAKLSALVNVITGADKAAQKSDKKLDDTALPALGQIFETAEAAVMRHSWSSNACTVATDFSSDPMWLQIFGHNRRKLIDGAWDLKVEQEGVEVVVDSPWQQICWLGDDDADYLELQCEAEGIFKVQRQIMFIRQEAIVFMCDTLLAEKSSQWHLTSSWQLSHDTQIEAFPDNTEVRLVACSSKKEKAVARPAAIALPIGLPEWRTPTLEGDLYSDQNTLTLHQYGVGTRLMCPMVLGIGANAVKQAYTWRQLTIADDMKIQSVEEARGFRVQIGSDQVLFYRSLGAARRRTMMSLHLSSEFYAGRFDREDGEIESLVEVAVDE